MDGAWHTIPETEVLGSAEELSLPRARSLAIAIQRHPDYTLLQCVRACVDGEVVTETLIVEVECHGVPHYNVHGIEFRERLALRVFRDTGKLVEARPLRATFPLLMHQHHVGPGKAPNLCLYYEPVRAVLRSWTPQRFLQRIQVWLEKSAKGTLHPADQPVEQLFFTSTDELVLPWNFEALSAEPECTFIVSKTPTRPDDGDTYFLRTVPSGQSGGSNNIGLLQVTLPPVVHGRPEVDHPTLGMLADALRPRGVDLLATLKDSLRSRLDDGCKRAASDSGFSILLLNIPVTRDAGGIVERTVRRAYLIGLSALELAVATGTFFELDGKYYKEQAAGFLAAGEKNEWRAQSIAALEVVRGLDQPLARLYSGIDSAGPDGALVGAGALGSILLDFWTRGGWGQWSVIDNDHLKPHNLVRHAADARFLGWSKAEAAKHRHDEVMQGAGQITAIHADACELDQEGVAPALSSAALIVDASTTLDYPRLASTRDDFGRHASTFVTPSGRDSVLLVEDAARTIRLRTLEAQYYRAVIRSEWGESHLDGNLGRLWSGGGCRDISLVMPHSRIVGHAATLAEQIRIQSQQAEAAIIVWERDGDTGAVGVHQVPVQKERRMSLDDFELFIDEGVIANMMAARAEQLPNETGGTLLGYFDFNRKSVVVVDALRAPPDSVSSPVAFTRGSTGVREAVTEAGRRTAEVVGYIGEWHSHPTGCAANPSQDDMMQLVELALGMSEEGSPVLTMIVGDGGDVQAMIGEVRQ
ncbi:hypothetical protein MasN3_26610 [Massilia varians]|uniref:MPN domain-containing protein n=1 Tax=Massilia varians TaxID=457921 RepID=A0ABM8C7D1_9BURK|nr:Mov34/MPN/PAD-1 family protein [Massilia varians]BDT59167.1 hypothetical protein MasN3_26610 [Massilia varians]